MIALDMGWILYNTDYKMKKINDLLFCSTRTLMYYSNSHTNEDIIMIKQQFSKSSCTYYYI